jgi:2'-5' RNA ligase
MSNVNSEARFDPASLSEYTIVAFLDSYDNDRFLTEVKRFPRSQVEQLPPHLTILNKIFSDNEDMVVETIQNRLARFQAGVLSIQTSGLLTGENLRSGGITIAVGIDLNEGLLKLRRTLQQALRKAFPTIITSLQEEYVPHITISLSVTRDSAMKARCMDSPVPMPMRLLSLDLLRHGGGFFGYSRIKHFTLVSP